MSAKLDLDISQQSTLELRYQDIGSISLQVTDDAGIIQSLEGIIFTLDIYERDYEIAERLTAIHSDDNQTVNFLFDTSFWDSISSKTPYSFRIRRQADTEIKTIVNGDVIIK